MTPIFSPLAWWKIMNILHLSGVGLQVKHEPVMSSDRRVGLQWSDQDLWGQIAGGGLRRWAKPVAVGSTSKCFAVKMAGKTTMVRLDHPSFRLTMNVKTCYWLGWLMLIDVDWCWLVPIGATCHLIACHSLWVQSPVSLHSEKWQRKRYEWLWVRQLPSWMEQYQYCISFSIIYWFDLEVLVWTWRLDVLSVSWLYILKIPRHFDAFWPVQYHLSWNAMTICHFLAAAIRSPGLEISRAPGGRTPNDVQVMLWLVYLSIFKLMWLVMLWLVIYIFPIFQAEGMIVPPCVNVSWKLPD